ncbi:DUF397 domain-containing protein [Saccharothrix australiensis]|uniref:Uncharacterized protein DUF397 n=1 Tax=Saccharothrix australiensis TaxID=2072 RepID=A0A495W0N3_9PSEU|nr:DUF397 domain-containing protein [Saccharothrix australiensis]RKT53438.1 uncharacterized protein DUF397 [Saccharothrix australiensis]
MTSKNAWRKSSRSNQTNNCVEIMLTGRVSGVRDSKNTAGPALTFPMASFAAFRTALKRS